MDRKLGDTLARKLTLRRDSVLASLDPRYELKGQNVGGHTVPETHSTQRFSPGFTGPQVRVKGTTIYFMSGLLNSVLSCEI